MKGIGHIVWYADLDKLDLEDPWLKKWWIRQVLIHGRFEDIAKMDFGTIKKLLPVLRISRKIGSLWEDYFKYKEV